MPSPVARGPRGDLRVAAALAIGLQGCRSRVPVRRPPLFAVARTPPESLSEGPGERMSGMFRKLDDLLKWKPWRGGSTTSGHESAPAMVSASRSRAETLPPGHRPRIDR